MLKLAPIVKTFLVNNYRITIFSICHFLAIFLVQFRRSRNTDLAINLLIIMSQLGNVRVY